MAGSKRSSKWRQVNSGSSKSTLTPGRVGEILWRQKLVCAVVFGIILVIGSVVVLTRSSPYQSSSSVALLPPPKKPTILPNYPNIILSLVPTYVQLVSSPVLLNEVAAKLPFNMSESQLAADVHAEALSNAAIINIVAESRDPGQAREIAAVTTQTFLAHVSGNGVVVPRVYGQPTVPQPAGPSKSLLLVIVVILAAILAAVAALIWDHLAGSARGPRRRGTGHAAAPPYRKKPDSLAAQSEGATPAAGLATAADPFETVKLRPPAQMDDGPDAQREKRAPGAQSEKGSTDNGS